MSNYRKFDLEKAMANGGRCQTRDGRPARIICTDRKTACKEPIIVLVDHSSCELVYSACENGKSLFKLTAPSKFEDTDLVNIPVKRSGWVNIYPGFRTGSLLFFTEKEADRAAGSDRLTCTQIEWEE